MAKQSAADKAGVKVGGSTGQVLEKNSGTDFDFDWKTPSAADNLGNHIATQDLDMAGFNIKGFAANDKITDNNNNELIVFQPQASALNFFEFSNGATGVAPKILANSGFLEDDDVSFDIETLGTGILATNVGFSTPELVGTTKETIVKLTSAGSSSVNELEINNSLTGFPVSIAATGSDPNIALNVSAKGTKEIKMLSNVSLGTKSIEFDQQSVTFNSGTTILDWNSGMNARLILTGNIGTLLDFTNPIGIVGANYLLRVEQDATGSRTIAAWDGSIKWEGGAEPTLSTGINAVDIIHLYFDGSFWFGRATLNYS